MMMMLVMIDKMVVIMDDKEVITLGNGLPSVAVQEMSISSPSSTCKLISSSIIIAITT